MELEALIRRIIREEIELYMQERGQAAGEKQAADK
ncbi:hypothetical protein B2K_39550 [Paenibacillus mucilaginosus K02]|uniref:Uncharacterized protein n=1 Tax=Paenibacillus mucilaginosus K02 TaxID=997761 RepID=R9ULN8_9BACL|nr:hypothetical protein B2K_39550 [Paenibacillus mucilaginosus K02]